MLFEITLILLLISNSCAQKSSRISYEGYKIYDVFLDDVDKKDILMYFSANPKFDFISMPRALDEPARVMVPPEDQNKFEEIMNTFQINNTVFNINVEDSLQLERARLLKPAPPVAKFETFHRLKEIYDYLTGLQTSGHVVLEDIGLSFEGRQIMGAIIHNGTLHAGKKTVYVTAGMNGREWIGTSIALYIIHQLVENFNENKELLDEADWFVIPVVNPDGYEYTHTIDRFWRKTRKPVSAVCMGTDITRNFDFHWDEDTECHSAEPCYSTFKGPIVFSELETQMLNKALRRSYENTQQAKANFYLNLESYGDYLLTPYGYNTTDRPFYWSAIERVAMIGADAIYSASGNEYKVSRLANLLCPAGGNSVDYAVGSGIIPLAVTMQLPGGYDGVGPSPQEIRKTVSGMWTGIKAMVYAGVYKLPHFS